MVIASWLNFSCLEQELNTGLLHHSRHPAVSSNELSCLHHRIRFRSLEVPLKKHSGKSFWEKFCCLEQELNSGLLHDSQSWHLCLNHAWRKKKIQTNCLNQELNRGQPHYSCSRLKQQYVPPGAKWRVEKHKSISLSRIVSIVLLPGTITEPGSPTTRPTVKFSLLHFLYTKHTSLDWVQ